MPRAISRLVAQGLAWIAFSSAAAADDIPVDLELVLAVDVSASMDPDEQRLQRMGYVAAFRAPSVIAAVEAGALGRIAVAFVEWADPDYQRIVLPWTLVDGAGSAEAVAGRLAEAPFDRGFGTSIAQALTFSAGLFHGNGFSGSRLTIDVSGDGPDNIGPPLTPARERVVSQGITVNGLPVMLRVGWPTGLYSIADLDLYYHDCVIGGPDAFMLVVKRRSELGKAIERKLVLEIMSERPAGVVPISAVGWMDCTRPKVE